MSDPIETYIDELGKRVDAAQALRPLLNNIQIAISSSEAKAVTMVRDRRDKPYICICMFCDDLKEVVPLMRELAKFDLRGKDYEDDSFFETLSTRIYHLSPQVDVMVMLSGENCRRVQVGTKTVPVYEMQCGSTPETKSRISDQYVN